jgi:hypothetical protein
MKWNDRYSNKVSSARIEASVRALHTHIVHMYRTGSIVFCARNGHISVVITNNVSQIVMFAFGQMILKFLEFGFHCVVMVE